VAVAAATPQTGRALFDAVLDLTPGTYVRKGLPAPGEDAERQHHQAGGCGAGQRFTDQRPGHRAFRALGRRPLPPRLPAAIRACVRAGGDMDTTAAITGAIVATQTGPEGIPSTWLLTREPLHAWIG
jgi:hypothetical protein